MIPMSNELEFIVYSTPAEDVRVDAAVKDETVWLTQKGMAELFGVGIPAISKHLKNIFEEGELRESLVVSNLEITTPHGAMPGKTQQQKTREAHAAFPSFYMPRHYLSNRLFIFSRKLLRSPYSRPVVASSNCRSSSFCFSVSLVGTSTRTRMIRSPT